MVSLEEAKSYLKVENSDDDITITSLITASDLYIKNSCGNYIENDLSTLAQKLLIAHWYENREPVGKADKLAFSLESILIQIKYCGVVESDGVLSV